MSLANPQRRALVCGLATSALLGGTLIGMLTGALLAVETESPSAQPSEPAETVLASGRPKKKVIGAKPITIELCSSTELRQQLWSVARQPKGPLRLTVHDVQYTDAPVEVRLFFAAPKATARTSAEDPHYLGSFAFFGHSDADEPHSFVFDVGQVIRALAKAKEFEPNEVFSVTMFAAPLVEGEEIDNVSLKFDRVDISTPEQ